MGGLLRKFKFWLGVFRHPRTPWYAKLLLVLALLYLLWPFDLLPDTMPLFGLIDDVTLAALLVAGALRLVPVEARSGAEGVK